MQSWQTRLRVLPFTNASAYSPRSSVRPQTSQAAWSFVVVLMRFKLTCFERSGAAPSARYALTASRSARASATTLPAMCAGTSS
jgi:hypothetical protein